MYDLNLWNSTGHNLPYGNRGWHCSISIKGTGRQSFMISIKGTGRQSFIVSIKGTINKRDR